MTKNVLEREVRIRKSERKKGNQKKHGCSIASTFFEGERERGERGDRGEPKGCEKKEWLPNLQTGVTQSSFYILCGLIRALQVSNAGSLRSCPSKERTIGKTVLSEKHSKKNGMG